MKKQFTSLFFLFALLLGINSCESDPNTYAEIETEYGNMVVQLYNSTPKHRDNFVRLAEDEFYDGLLFHRVIGEFMIQGGDPDSRDADANKPLGFGGPGYEVQAEIGAIHVRGSLAAARNENPDKRSSGSQFYLVQGRTWTDAMLDKFQSDKGITYLPEQRELYKTVGGTPALDNEYTVFGMVVEGLDVIDKIAAVETSRANRPVKDISMKVRILSSYP